MKYEILGNIEDISFDMLHSRSWLVNEINEAMERGAITTEEIVEAFKSALGHALD